MQLSRLSLSLLGTGPPDAGPVIQEHHPLWALKLHTQLPPSKRVGRGGGRSSAPGGGAEGGHVSCSQLPDAWLPWGTGRQRGGLCERDLAVGLQRAMGQWGCRSPQAPSVAWAGAAQAAARERGFCWGLEHRNVTPRLFCSLQLCVILEPMQELMSRHKTYSLSPRDCLKTCLFQKWQRMVAPPGESDAARCAARGSPGLPAQALPSMQASPSPRACPWPRPVRLGVASQHLLLCCPAFPLGQSRAAGS